MRSVAQRLDHNGLDAQLAGTKLIYLAISMENAVELL